MLDKATLEWLERRKSVEDFCCTICDWEPDQGIDCDHCWPKEGFFRNRNFNEMKPRCCEGDYKDALEFEARVAANLANGEDCHITDDCVFFGEGVCAWCELKEARLTVEQEMIREGKGPGRLEDA